MMRKQVFTGITMLGLFLTLAVASVQAQTERNEVTNIPFKFVVGQNTLPAGKYRVESRTKNSDTVWLIQSTDSSASAVAITTPVRVSTTQEESKLIFHRYGDLYFLTQVWTAGANVGREFSTSSQERAVERELAKGMSKSKMAKKTAKPQMVTMVASR